MTVVQPNEDGSYWRKIVRNKMIRMKEKRRVQAAKASRFACPNLRDPTCRFILQPLDRSHCK